MFVCYFAVYDHVLSVRSLSVCLSVTLSGCLFLFYFDLEFSLRICVFVNCVFFLFFALTIQSPASMSMLHYL